jgi:beta-glucosidase
MNQNKTRLLSVLCILLAGLSALGQSGGPVQPGLDKRVEEILGRMSLEEKIDYIGGYNEFYIRAIPRFGVPELKMADGPMGVRNYGPSTAYPAGIALAASWDTGLVNRVGVMMGKDARARGVHIILGCLSPKLGPIPGQ